MPNPARIDSTQASEDQTACGATPVVCSAQLAPVSAQDARKRCISIPRNVIRISASPAALSSTWRKLGANICKTALMAASIIPQQLRLAATASKAVDHATGESVTSRAGTRGVNSSGPAAGKSVQANVL